MKPLYRNTLLHDASPGILSNPGMSAHKLGSNSTDDNSANSWSDQLAGSGHVSASNDTSGAFSRVPPRMFGSAISGAGGAIRTPEWPLGHDWADSGGNFLGGRKRHRYWWRCCVIISSTDTLTWGPCEVGIATSVSGIEFGSVTGVALRIGQRTGDGSLFPNPEDGWGLQWRFVTSSPTDPLGPPGGFYTPSTRMNLTWVYLDAPAPILRVYVGNGIRGAFNGLNFQRPAAHTNAVYGPYISGRTLSWGHKLKVDELEDTEDPWADVLTVN